MWGFLSPGFMQLRETRQRLEEHMAHVAGRRGGPGMDADVRGMRGHINHLQMTITADEDESRLLDSNATKFLLIALANYRR